MSVCLNVGWSSSQLRYTQEHAGGRTGNLTSKMQNTRHWTFYHFSLFFSINVVFTWDEEVRFNALPSCRAICNFYCSVNRESRNSSVINASISLPQIPVQPHIPIPLPELGDGSTLRSAHYFCFSATGPSTFLPTSSL